MYSNGTVRQNDSQKGDDDAAERQTDAQSYGEDDGQAGDGTEDATEHKPCQAGATHDDIRAAPEDDRAREAFARPKIVAFHGVSICVYASYGKQIYCEIYATLAR